MREILKDLSICRNMPCKCIGRTQYWELTKMSILPKLIYKFSAIPKNNNNKKQKTSVSFMERQVDTKFHIEIQRVKGCKFLVTQWACSGDRSLMGKSVFLLTLLNRIYPNFPITGHVLSKCKKSSILRFYTILSTAGKGPIRMLQQI